MAKFILPIREEDRRFLEAIKNGKKTIETRAATPKYRQVQPGDILVFRCGEEKLEKKVKEAHVFNSVEELAKTLGIKDIMPFATSVEEMKATYFSFPGYQEKIEKYGLIAFRME
ncbi:ASCH domain-containing protein [Candidatus Shapirobacteria bacterium]|nr:ASCH domain-containing protein [Candidatus Shapirobacteria bacterium]